MDGTIRDMTPKEIRTYKSVAGTVVMALALAGLFSRCANIAAPQGGPKDSLAPRVVRMSPGYGATDFNGKRIDIEFDEYIKLVDQQKEFYTSPLMETAPTLTLRGKTLRVDSKEDLEPNRTYAYNFGSAVRDNNESNPYTGLRYVFSTGPEIDSLLMSGFTADALTGDTVGKVFIYFYENGEGLTTPYDSTMFLEKPRAVGRAMPNGIFVAENLRPVDYRIYGFEDLNGDMKYQPGADRVAFLDSLYNPAHMPSFEMWYDTTRSYIVAEPQIMLRLFADEVFKRQNLTSKTRPMQNKVVFDFLGPYPQIDTLRFDGVDPSEVITEYMTPLKDSIAYWFNVPPERLPDTLRGRLAYQRTDSTGVLSTYGEDLRLVWQRPQVSRQQQRAEEQQADTLKPEPLKVTVKAGRELTPEDKITFEFDYPLSRLDSAAILLEKLPEAPSASQGRAGQGAAALAATAAAGEPAKFSFIQDTLNVRKWVLGADWKEGERYRLTIPAGTFEDILSHVNDTLRSDFSITFADKFFTLILNVDGETPDSEYIIQILQGRAVMKERSGISSGTHTFKYITPAPNLSVRVIQDLNRNGAWDAGSLVERRQSERTEIFIHDGGNPDIPGREGFYVTYDVDMNKIFRPVDVEYIRDRVSVIESRRMKQRAEALQLRQEGTQTGTHTH